MSLIELLPGWTIGFIAGIVILSFVAFFLRLILHTHLINQGRRVRRLIHRPSSGNKPKIVDYLENRFAEASKKLEQVNTVALIDQVYSRERVGFISCEQIDYFCRLLPNLLISLGLLGTFIGITINLNALSQTIGQTTVTDVNSLLQQLQRPLEGMGIAFTTSLAGIAFSAFLIFWNFLFNTKLAKDRLISALEDYLDNIYFPTLEGQTRMDIVVKGMTNSFDAFLAKFGQTVRESVSLALQDKLQEIFDANMKVTVVAEQLYGRLSSISGTIAKSAEEFQRAGDRFIEAAQALDHSQFPRRLSNATAELANAQRDFAQSASVLAESVQGIELAVVELQSYSKRLNKLGEDLNHSNQMSVRVLELHQNNQESLSEVIPQLQEGSRGFYASVKNFDKLQRILVARVENVDEVQGEITRLVATLKTYTEEVNRGIQTLGDRFAEGLDNQSDNTDAQFKLVVKNLQQCINYLNETKHEISRMRQTLERTSGERAFGDPTPDIVRKLNEI